MEMWWHSGHIVMVMCSHSEHVVTDSQWTHSHSLHVVKADVWSRWRVTVVTMNFACSHASISFNNIIHILLYTPTLYTYATTQNVCAMGMHLTASSLTAWCLLSVSTVLTSRRVTTVSSVYLASSRIFLSLWMTQTSAYVSTMNVRYCIFSSYGNHIHCYATKSGNIRMDWEKENPVPIACSFPHMCMRNRLGITTVTENFTEFPMTPQIQFESSMLWVSLLPPPPPTIVCECDPAGIIDSGLCDDEGQCNCKTNVDSASLKCSVCEDGFWNLTAENPLGCEGMYVWTVIPPIPNA